MKDVIRQAKLGQPLGQFSSEEIEGALAALEEAPEPETDIVGLPDLDSQAKMFLRAELARRLADK